MNIKHFTNESTKTIKKTICLEDEVDLEDKEISPYDIGYRLFLECDFKDERGNLDSPIEFQIPQKDIELFVEFFVSMVKTNNYTIKSESLVKLSQSDMFQNKSSELKSFVTNTYTKVMIKMTEYKKANNPYSLEFLLDLINSKSKINIRFDIDDEEVELSKTSIKKLIVKENGLDIKLSHSIINLSNINQIKLIQSYDNPFNQSNTDKEEQFIEDVEQLKNILLEIDNQYSKEMIEYINEMEILKELFEF